MMNATAKVVTIALVAASSTVGVLATASNIYQGCDESKCVSRGRVDNEEGSFTYDRFDREDVVTCYGEKDGDQEEIFFPMMCADGYLPVIVEDEPPVFVSGATRNCINKFWRAYIVRDFTDLPLHYFTCCPPTTGMSIDNEQMPLALDSPLPKDPKTSLDETASIILDSSAEMSPSRHCSDSVWAPSGWSPDDDDADETIASLCAGMADRKYPRRTKKQWNTATFVCCDSPFPDDDEETTEVEMATETETDTSWVETSTSYLDEVDCIPFSNRWYDRGFLDRNRVGRTWINKRLCDFPGGDGRFKYPRSIDGEDDSETSTIATTKTRRFQCCQTNDNIDLTLQPYVKDSRFYIEAYTWLVLFTVAAIASALIAIALSLPILLQQNRKASVDGSTNTHAANNKSSFQTRDNVNTSRTNLTTGRRHQSSYRKSSYSPYNLYLVYLAIPDLIISLTFVFGVSVRMINQQPVAHNLVGSIAIAYGLANCLLNAIVCRQVLELLRRSSKRQRVPPPSLIRVTLEAICVYVFSAIMFSMTYFPVYASEKAYNNGNYEKGSSLETVSTTFLSITGVCAVLPIGYVVYVSYIVWRRKYIPPATKNMCVINKANRALAIYFFRIVAVFFIVWILGAIVGGLAASFTLVEGNNWPMYVFFTLVAIQQIATTGVILMSRVSRKYIKDLLTCSYFRHDQDQDRDSANHANQTHNFPDSSHNNSITNNSLSDSNTPSNPNLIPANEGGGSITKSDHSNESSRNNYQSSVNVWLSRDHRKSEDSLDILGISSHEEEEIEEAKDEVCDEILTLGGDSKSRESKAAFRESMAMPHQFSSSRDEIEQIRKLYEKATVEDLEE